MQTFFLSKKEYFGKMRGGGLFGLFLVVDYFAFIARKQHIPIFETYYFRKGEIKYGGRKYIASIN